MHVTQFMDRVQTARAPPFPYLDKGLMHCADIWSVLPTSYAFYACYEWVHLHVRTLSHILEAAGRVVLIRCAFRDPLTGH